MRITWVTDPHLDFVPKEQRDDFVDLVAKEEPDALFLTGDIARSLMIVICLRRFAKGLTCPTYFVLGNHDYYGSSIAKVRQQMKELCTESEKLVWLPAAGVIELTPEVCLIGHGGWGDGLAGNAEKSPIILNDWHYIEELAIMDKKERLARLAALGQEAAAHLEKCINDALGRYKQILILMHVPPFREACWHNGEISDDDWAPHFTNEAAGKVLLAAARNNPHVAFTVFCGHTHSDGVARMEKNLLVNTGDAIYRAPAVQETFILPG
mgnify:FL=1